MIKLFATDMDQTFLDNNSLLPKRTQFIIDRLNEEKKLFIIASGRTLTNIEHKLKDIRHNLTIIADNGAILKHKGEILYTDKIEPYKVYNTVELARRMKDTTVIVITPTMAYIDTNHPTHIAGLREYYTDLEIVDDVLDYVENDVVKITTFSPTASDENFETYLKPNLDSTLHGVRSGDNWIDITNQGVNKGKALNYIMDIYNIKRNEVVTFGDYCNDLEMIRDVKYGYAVENAVDGLKKHAYKVIGKNTDDAVINKIIEHLDE